MPKLQPVRIPDGIVLPSVFRQLQTGQFVPATAKPAFGPASRLSPVRGRDLVPTWTSTAVKRRNR